MNSFWHIIKHHVHNGHLRAVGVEMLVGAFMMLIAGMILMGASMSSLRALGLSARVSQDALQHIAEIESGILSSELALRGYAMTGDRYFIGRYQMRAQELRTATLHLNQILAGVPSEAKALATLTAFANRRLETFQALIDAGPENRAVLAVRIVSPALRGERISARNLLEAMRVKEIRRLEDRQTQAETELKQSFILSTVIVVLAFCLAVLGLGLMGAIDYFRHKGKTHPTS